MHPPSVPVASRAWIWHLYVSVTLLQQTISSGRPQGVCRWIQGAQKKRMEKEQSRELVRTGKSRTRIRRLNTRILSWITKSTWQSLHLPLAGDGWRPLLFHTTARSLKFLLSRMRISGMPCVLLLFFYSGKASPYGRTRPLRVNAYVLCSHCL